MGRAKIFAMIIIITALIATALPFADAATVTKATVTVNKIDGSILSWRCVPVYNAKGGSLSRTMPKGTPGPLPPGSFYFKVGYSSDPVPAQVWLGTDNYFGVYLKNITKLEYYTYMVLRGDETTPPTFYPYQPIQLQIHTSKNGSTGDPHYFVFRPWGKSNGGDPSGGQCGVWQKWNCMSSEYKWYDPYGAFINGVWKHWFTWNEIVSYFPEAMIDRSSSVGNSWPALTPVPTVASPGMGCGFNFVAGGRMKVSNGQATPDWDLTAWWREAYNAEGSMDAFTIGVKKSDGSIKETTFDFDVTSPAVRPPAYALNNKAAVGGKWWLDGDIYNSSSNPYGKWTASQVFENLTEIQKAANNNNCLYAVYGKVLNYPYPNGSWFSIDDGAGLKIKVYAQGAVVKPGDYVRVKGSVRVPMPYDWGASRAYDHIAPGVLNTSTQPYVPTLPVEFHSFPWDVEILN